MKNVLYLLAAFCLLGAKGCPSDRPTSPRARLIVKSASVRDLSPSAVSSAIEADNQVAVAKVMAHVHNPRFQSEVGQALGVSSDTVGSVIFRNLPDSRVVELRADLADPQLAAKVLNAVARQLAQDFANSSDVELRVLSYPTAPGPTR